MSPASFAMVDELDEETVEFVANYDQTETEPEVLPARLPNLIVNGSTGIAVGMATNMAPHNLREVIAGLQALLADPKLTIDGFMEHVPGPDFPTGGIIIGREGIKEAYRTGRGQFRIRARTTIENTSPRRRGIVVSELPYNVGPEKVIAKIKELAAQKRLNGVADIKDLSDRKTGLRLVIDCKNGFEPETVLQELFRLTPLEESFSVNNVALVRGEPRTLGMMDLAREFLAHRLDVVRRRSEYRKAKAEARAHIVEGLVLALASIDEVVAVIKASKDTDVARTKLMNTFTLSEIQANAILEMALRRLTSLEVNKLKAELKELNETIAALTKLLGSEKLLRKQVSVELDEVRDTYGTDRRSLLIDESQVIAVTAAAVVNQQTTQVTFYADGSVARVDEGSSHRPARAVPVRTVVDSHTRANVMIITDRGRLMRLAVAELPAASGKSMTVPLSDYVDLASNERPIALVTAGHALALMTRRGVVKRLKAESLPTRSGSSVISLQGDDVLVGVVSGPSADIDATDLVAVTASAQLLRFSADKVRPQGNTAGGMAGIKLAAGDEVIAFGATSPGEPNLVTVTDTGSVKVTPISVYPIKGRGTSGVRCHTFRKDESKLARAYIGSGSLLAVTATGSKVDLPQTSAKRDGSGAVTTDKVEYLGLSNR